MVGRTKLYQRVRSPLIGGHTRRRRRVWPWVVSVLVVLAAIAAVWYFFLR